MSAQPAVLNQHTFLKSETRPGNERRSLCERRHYRQQPSRCSAARRLEASGTQNEQLLLDLLPLVKRIALRMRGHLPSHVELDDLTSAGVLGLIDAVSKFDP